MGVQLEPWRKCVTQHGYSFAQSANHKDTKARRRKTLNPSLEGRFVFGLEVLKKGNRKLCDLVSLW